VTTAALPESLPLFMAAMASSGYSRILANERVRSEVGI
jgi:hypothetical protein